MSSEERTTPEITRHFDERSLLEELRMESLSTFAGGIVHELNNFLSIILPNLAMAMSTVETENSDSGLREDLGEIEKATVRLRAFIDQVLMVCQTSESHLSQENPLDLIRESLKVFQDSVPGSVTLEQQLDSECPSIWIEPQKFKQIVVSLCSEVHRTLRNPAGAIAVLMEPFEISNHDKETLDLPVGRYIKLCVNDADAATSVSRQTESDSPNIRLDPLSNCMSPGVFVSYCILRLKSGRLDLHQLSTGGTCYTAYWPVVENGKSKVFGGFQDHSVGMGKKVLLVEDKVSNCRMIQRFLEDFGFEVSAHLTPGSAWKVFQHNPSSYDLVLTDYAIPEFSGLVLSNRIRRIRYDIPIIMMMNLVDAEKRKVVSDAGIHHLLKKPVDSDMLFNVVSELVHSSSGRVS